MSRWAGGRLALAANEKKGGVIRGLRNSVVPTGLASFVTPFPALKRWAKLRPPLRGSISVAAFPPSLSSFAQVSARAPECKGCVETLCKGCHGTEHPEDGREPGAPYIAANEKGSEVIPHPFDFGFFAFFYFYYTNLARSGWTWFASLFSLSIHWVMREIVEMGG